MVVDGGYWGNTPYPETTFTKYDFYGAGTELDIPAGQAPSPGGSQGNMVFFAKEEDGSATTNGCYAGTVLKASTDGRIAKISSGPSQTGPWTERGSYSVKDLVEKNIKVYCPDPYVLFSELANNYLPQDWYIFTDKANIYQDHVEYQTNGGQGNVVKIEGTNIYLNDTGDRDNRWIAENKARVPFYVGTPSKVTGDPLNKDDVVFISHNGTPPTIEFTADPTGSVSLFKRHWYLRESTTLDGLTKVPFTKYTEDLVKVEGEDPGPWTQNLPTLKNDTYYEVACQYEDNNGYFEPPTFNQGANVTVGNRFKIAKRNDDYYPVSDPITDINSYDGTLTFGGSSELAEMEGPMVMVTDPTDDTNPPVPASYIPVTE